MELKEIIQLVRGNLLKGKTEEALMEMGSFLDKQGTSFIDEYNLVIKLTSQFRQTKQSAQANLISFEDAQVVYSQINNSLLTLVKDLENPKGNTTLLKKKRPIWPFVTIGGLLIAAAAVYFFWPTKEGESCPTFAPDTEFDILVLPFNPLTGDKVTPTHRLFEIGLNRLIDDYNLTGEANVESYAESIALQDDYPTGVQDAKGISENCGSQLIIWGITEKLPANNQTILTTNYLFLEEDDIHLDRQELGMDAELKASDITMQFPERGLQRDTIASFSSISDNLPPHLESRLKFLLGVFAHEKGDNMATRKLLEKWPEDPLDPESTQIWATLLADSYLKTDEEEKAEATYSRLIETDPSNALARNNRAILYYKKGEYAMAIQDLNVNLKNNSKDTVALITRSYVFLKEGMIEQAEKDLKSAKKLDPNRPIIQSWQQKIETRRQAEERTFKKAEAQLKENPKDVQALMDKAIASRNLGNYNIARKAAEEVIKINPKSVQAYDILRESDMMLKRNSRVLQRAERNGIPAAQLKNLRPILEATAAQEKQ